jgi:mono/diheme cytochrome c family protein
MNLSLLFRPAAMTTGLVCLLFSAACSYTKGNEDAPAPCAEDVSAVRFKADIVPILQANCYKCHGKDVALGLGGGHNWEDTKQLQAYAKDGTLVKVVEQIDPDYKIVYMPRDNPKLSVCDIQRIKAWVAGGSQDN